MKNVLTIALFLFAAVCLNAQDIVVTPVDFNSSSDDFASAPARNGRMIFFTTDRDGMQKIYYVERTSGGWSRAKEIRGNVNEGEMNGSATLTPGRSVMLFASYKHTAWSVGRTDLYSSLLIDGERTEIENLGRNVNSDSWDSQPSLTSDGNTLYFASDRPGGYGGTDIYVSRKTINGWSIPENLGPTINTSSDEMSPVIGDDMKTFTFASNRGGGYGGFDIYFAKLNGGNFSSPIIAPEPINSNADEYFYYPLSNSDRAYFSSNRSGGAGELDVYQAAPNPYPTDAVVYAEGKSLDASNMRPIGCKIIVTDLVTSKKIAEFMSDGRTGDYFVALQPGRNYSITAERPGYLFYSEAFRLPPTDEGYSVEKNLLLSPIEAGRTRLLVFFDFDKSNLQDESIPELERIVEFLRSNPGVSIMLEGHTDDVGSDDYNDKLSLDRAASVKAYLTNAGIKPTRIQTKGLGKRNPLVQGTDDASRAMNRRVEMLILN